MAILHIISRVNRILTPVGIGALLVMMTIVTINVLGRAIINAPFFGTIEIVELSGAIMVSGFLAYTQFQRQNITVTIITNKLSPRLRQAFDAFALFLGLIFIALVIWTSSTYALSIPKEFTNVFQITRLPFRLIFVLGCAVLFFVFLGQLIESVVKVVKR